MKNETIKEIIKFLIVGIISTMFDYSIFYLFNLIIFKDINETINLIIATALGFLVGLVINYILQKFVFKEAEELIKKKKTFIKFFITSLIGLLITELIINCFKFSYDKFYINFIFEIDFWKIFIKCMTTLIVLIYNFLTKKFIVFKKKEEILDGK